MSISALRRPADVDAEPGGGSALRRRARALATGRPQDPRWVRPALLAILAATAFLALWHLSRNGWSNEYYAAAARSGSLSWKAWFFGSIDPGSFITVDKPPLSLWAMGLSARVLGWSSFAMLLPQALFTVGSVAVLVATVRRVFGPVAGLIAGAALAVTPVIVAVGRVNNPDALLILLLIVSAYLAVRAIETGRTAFLVGCGAVVGLAFMTKMLEGWMVVPALAGAYLLAGPPRLATRIRQLALAAAAMVVVSAAWPLAVTLWPGSTPYIGGSTNGSIWDLILGYNGFGRLTGSEGGMGGGASFGGQPGLWRMFNEQVGGQVAWLLPLALVSLAAGLWLTRRAPRSDRTRAGFVLFGLWTLVLVAVFSSQQGIFHPYYVSALAPAVAALTGGGLVVLVGWARRSWTGLAVLDTAIAATAWLAVDLLDRTPDFAPALRTVVPAAAAVAIAASVALRLPPVQARGRAALAVAAVAAAVALGAAPAAYAIVTVSRSLDGNNVLAGPASAGAGGFGGGGGGRGFGGTPPSGAGAPPSRTGSGPGSSASAPGAAPFGASGEAPAGDAPAGGGAADGGGSRGSSVSRELIAYLEAHQGSAKYLVAATGSQATAPIIIATGKPVVTIGGFSGSDPAPTVAQLQALVAGGQLRYVLIGGGGGMGRGGSSDLTQWVQEHGTAVTSVTTSGGTLYRVTA